MRSAFETADGFLRVTPLFLGNTGDPKCAKEFWISGERSSGFLHRLVVSARKVKDGCCIGANAQGDRVDTLRFLCVLDGLTKSALLWQKQRIPLMGNGTFFVEGLYLVIIDNEWK